MDYFAYICGPFLDVLWRGKGFKIQEDPLTESAGAVGARGQ